MEFSKNIGVIINFSILIPVFIMSAIIILYRDATVVVSSDYH